MKFKFAERINNVRPSFIREGLKLSSQSNIITFTAGNPAPELYPIEELSKATEKIYRNEGKIALAYGSTDGYLPLREKIAKRMQKKGIKCTAADVLPITGSQQGLDLAGKSFLDKGDLVVCENPTYLAAINTFCAYECSFLTIDTDTEGMIMEDLDQKLSENPHAKLIYVVSTFQNPTGITWSLERRKELLAIASKYNIPIIEDDPYGELRYEGEEIPPIKAFDTEGLVTYLGSFSKVLCPGVRLGWMIAEPETLHVYNKIKQATDLQTSTLIQMVIDKYLEENDLDERITVLKDFNKRRRDLMLEQLEKHFPEGTQYNRPEGGLFIWISLPEEIDTAKLVPAAINSQVVFIPGEPFYPNSSKKNKMRLNFSSVEEDRIIEGIQRLGKVIQKNL